MKTTITIVDGEVSIVVTPDNEIERMVFRELDAGGVHVFKTQGGIGLKVRPRIDQELERIANTTGEGNVR